MAKFSCEKSRTLAIARAKAASEENVTAYFQELDQILTKYNLTEKPQHMYNIDEKGISENHNPPKVVDDKHVTPVSVCYQWYVLVLSLSYDLVMI